MTTTTVVRYRTTPDLADENERLVGEVFAELAESKPDGLQYATSRLPDGVSFRDRRGVGRRPTRVLTRLHRIQADIGSRCVEGPAPAAATAIELRTLALDSICSAGRRRARALRYRRPR